MPVPLSLATAITRFTPLAGQAVKRFQRQPTLLSTASELVGQALMRLQPPVLLPPDRVALAWPDTSDEAQALDYVTLPEILIDLFIRDRVLTVVPEYQRLMQHLEGRWVELPVNLQSLAEELDVVRPALLESFEQSLAQFWSEADAQGKTNWEWMGDYLQNSLRNALEEGRAAGRIPKGAWDAGMAVVTGRGQEATAERLAAGGPRACLLQIQEGGTALPFDTRMDPHLLISFPTRQQVECHLLFSPDTGVRFFASTQALRRAVDLVLSGTDVPDGVVLQRVSVQGDVFVALARTLLQVQLIQVTGLAAKVRRATAASPSTVLKAASDVLTGFFQLDARTGEQSARALQQALPRWLRQASALDRWHFAAGLAKLANARSPNENQWFLHDIPTLQAYTFEQMGQEAARLHPAGPPLVPENVAVSIVSVIPDFVAVAGGPSDVQLAEAPVSVADLAIDNLAAHTGAWWKVSAKAGATVPAWLNESTLKTLIQTIDVGARYPAMLRNRLLDGPEASAREQLFREQVMLQLPLLAWEYKLRGQFGFDQEGCRLIQEGVGAAPSENTANFVGLGVSAGPGYGVDIIAGTFLFIREQDTAAPCVLYRPLHGQPLRQFASLDALWEELSAPGEVQDSVLLWMTDLGRARYSRGGFRAPRVARFGQGDEFAPLEQAAPARPALVPLAGPRLHGMYEQVVTALVTMAQRRAVSNAEDKWVSLGQLVDTLFSGLLPVLSGPVATAGWLVQLGAQFNRYLDALDEPGDAADSARSSLLFTVVMLLLSEAVHWPMDEPRPGGENEPGRGAEQPEMDEGAPARQTGPGEPSVVRPQPVVELGWANVTIEETSAPSRPLDLDLDWRASGLAPTAGQARKLLALRASPPVEPLTAVPHGAEQGLYFYDRQWLMKWQQHFYAVTFDEIDPRIVGPAGEPGPYIRRDEAGRWTLDLRLRLRGGGPKRRIEARRLQNQQAREQAAQLYNEIMTGFETLRDRANPLVAKIGKAAQRQEPAINTREKLDELLREGHQHAAGLIARYQEMHAATPLPDYADRICHILARQLHISKTLTDNLSELSNVYVQTSPYLTVSDKAVQQLVLADPAKWRAFLERYRELAERAVTYVRAHHDTLKHIDIFPGLGAKTLQENASAVDTLHSVIELQSSLAYCELGLLLEPLRTSPVLADKVHAALEPLLIHGTSHADLLCDPAATDEQKTQVLDTAIDQYQRVEDALKVFKGTFTAEQRSTAMDRFEGIAVALREDAEARLGELVRSTVTPSSSTSGERGNPRRQPRPKTGRKGGKGTKPGAQTSQRPAPEVIVTADGESVMVHTRVDQQTKMKVAEVVANGKVLASWRQDAKTGSWHRPAPVATQSGSTLGLRLDTLMADADRALEQAREEVSAVARFKQVTQVPADIQDQYHGSARRLEGLAEDIEEALTQLNATDAATRAQGSAELKAHELRNLAASARRLGTQARIDLCKSMVPTVGRLQFLIDQGQVTIRKLGERAPLGRGGRRDFLQEYEIRDLQQHSLWYAHFHYDTANAPGERFIAAHLKTVTQRFDGYQKQLQQARNDQEVVRIYRSRIDLSAARRLFLSLR